MLMAVMAMPAMAANPDTTDVTGTVPFTIDVTAPSDIGFGTFVDGINSDSSDTAGTVTCNGTTWSVTAKDLAGTDPGYMKSAGNKLGAKLEISKDGTTFAGADAGVVYDGQPTALSFWAQQTVALATDKVGAYSITITFTGSGS